MSASSDILKHGLEATQQNLRTHRAAQDDTAKQHLLERLLSHYDAGTSAPDVGPATRQLRAQICSLGLLSRNVQLPHRLLANAGVQSRKFTPTSQVVFYANTQIGVIKCTRACLLIERSLNGSSILSSHLISPCEQGVRRQRRLTPTKRGMSNAAAAREQHPVAAHSTAYRKACSCHKGHKSQGSISPPGCKTCRVGKLASTPARGKFCLGVSARSQVPGSQNTSLSCRM